MQEVLYIILLSSGSVVALFLLTKFMGYRQLSEMSLFDYINGITIGSIAAEMATSLENNYTQPLTAMIVYSVFSVALSKLGQKSLKAREIIEGKPVILLNNGKIYEKNLKKAKIDLSDLLVQCRTSGYFDISKLQTVVLEDNGKFSILPKSTDRPVTPSDLGIAVKQEFLVVNLIIDGKVMHSNLQHSGKDIKWLNNQLSSKGANSIENVLLASCDIDNNLTVYLKNNEEGSYENKLID